MVQLLTPQLYHKNFCPYYIFILLTYFYKLKFEQKAILFDLVAFVLIFFLLLIASQLYHILHNYITWKYLIRFILTDLATGLGCYLFTVVILLQFNFYPNQDSK